jgi:plasmid stabilization system protein ParE
MSQRVLKFSNLALEGQANIQYYLYDTFGEKAGDSYQNGLEDILELIRHTPAIFPLLHKEKDAHTHKCVFQSLTIILYRFDDTTVYIDDICDSRSGWDIM